MEACLEAMARYDEVGNWYQRQSAERLHSRAELVAGIGAVGPDPMIAQFAAREGSRQIETCEGLSERRVGYYAADAHCERSCRSGRADGATGW